jgi:hypothetical protein
VLTIGAVCFVTGVFVPVALSAIWRGARHSLPPPAPNTQLGQTIAGGEGISDPFVLPTTHLDFMYSSGFAGSAPWVPLRTFKTMTHLSGIHDAMPRLPLWASRKYAVWAPDVRKVGNHYVMWYTAVWGARRLPSGAPPKCVGWAVASSPYGPFVDTAPKPRICQLDDFGDIDPRTFVDPSGQEWLHWKSDDNAGNTAHNLKITKIWAQPLGPDGTTLRGSPRIIFKSEKTWEGRLVEAPQMVLARGTYYLFFSGGASGSEASGIGLAICNGPAGPCRSPYPGPWLGSNFNGAGPDELSLFQQAGNTWLLYTPSAIYYRYSFPSLAVTRVAFGPDGPYAARFDGAMAGIPGASPTK